jgi:aminomethyltransferase
MAAAERSSQELRSTPLTPRHREAGGRLVEFAGFLMPVQYEGLVAEHRAVREAAGLFDVSHMGEFEIRGPDAARLCERVTPSSVSRLPEGRALYTALLTENGTFVDDILVYHVDSGTFLLVVNAANVAKDLAWILGHAGGMNVEVHDRSEETALLALQGPVSRDVLARVADGFDPLTMKYYRVTRGAVAGKPVIASRTGYTGEIGFEIFVRAGDAAHVWDALIEAGEPCGLRPAGLGARDTLRLEAGLPLYGNDIDEDRDVISAGLEFIVEWENDGFVGREALMRLREEGVRQRRMGLVLTGRGIARRGSGVFDDERPVAEVTSGSWGPYLERSIAMAYLPLELAEEGRELSTDVRGRRIPARVSKLPFYRRPKKRRPGGAAS